jgi:hypothetical protein
MRMSDFRYFGFQEETVKYDFPLPKISLQQEQADE